MFQPNADPSVQYDFARIDLAKKKRVYRESFCRTTKPHRTDVEPLDSRTFFVYSRKRLQEL